MRKVKLLQQIIVLSLGVFYTMSAEALPLAGSAQTTITNISIFFSDISAVDVTRKGMYPASLNGTHADTEAIDNVNGVTESQTIENGFSLSTAGLSSSFAGLFFADIYSFPLSNDVYDNVIYGTSADGVTDSGTSIRSYSVINDNWFFTALAPFTMTISFDYVLSASGPVSNDLGNLITEAVVGLGVGLNDTTWYSSDYTDNGLLSGTISMGMGYYTGDRGHIYLWTSADVLSSQDPEPVPEPATLFLVASGLVFIASTRKRK